MKKLFIIFVFILICFTTFCIDVIDFNIIAEFGIIPNGHLKLYERNRDIFTNLSFYGDFYFEASFIKNILFLGIKSKIYLWKVKNTITFNPDAINFMFIVGLRYKFFELGFRHYCEHPIIAWINSYENSYWEQWYEEIYIKLSFNIN